MDENYFSKILYQEINSNINKEKKFDDFFDINAVPWFWLEKYFKYDQISGKKQNQNDCKRKDFKVPILKIFFFVKTSITLKLCINVVFIFLKFLVFTVEQS